jgi:hypothetical protein
VKGNIVHDGETKTIEFVVQSTTCINRIIRILCAIIDKDISQIKGVCVWCQYMTWSELHRINYDDNVRITFRDLSVVGKKSITINVNLDNFI